MRAFLLLVFLACSVACGAEPRNLVPDCSFESPLPSWFAERDGTSYFAAKERAEGAADGRNVLATAAWDERGSRICSPPLALSARMSGACALRSFGRAQGATAALALFAEKTNKLLVTFGQTPLDGSGQWHTISATGVALDPAVTTGRLGLFVRGPHKGLRIEVDSVGLFAGDRLGSVADNADLAVIEAETLADGKAWQAVDHYPNWYHGTPSAMRMLAGFAPVKPDDNRPLRCPIELRHSGPHTLWVRLLAGRYAGRFTVGLAQNGRLVAQREFAENDARFGQGFHWVWDSLAADLETGPAEIVLSRPAAGASWVTRKIDLLVLTNRPAYQPEIEDFLPPAYLRFTNLSTGQEPFCLWIHVRRHQGPKWYANPGILSHAGLSGSYYVPRERSKWLAPGETSPWVRITDDLLAAGARNNLQLVATRTQHTEGFVEGPLRGRLEFAAGPERRLVKTIDVNQDAPRLLLTLPHDFGRRPEEIKTARDYIAETEAQIRQLGPISGQPARALNLAANLSLRVGVDDPEVVRREVKIIESLGFNQTYRLIAPPDQAVEFCRQSGLLPRFGASPPLWRRIEHGSQHHPDVDAMRRDAAAFADENRPILDHLRRVKLMDEPSAMSYEEIAASEPCRTKFRAWLKAQGLSPAGLGAASWDEVVPMLPEQCRAKPRLFYYSGLFRLEGFATLARACVAAKQSCLPRTALAYVNYSPPTSGGSWTQRGTDLFLAHAPGGMEMVWTEDWLGYSLGPEHLSDTLALCRAAGRAQNCRLGAYCVGQATPLLMRLKYYTLVAGGVRDIVCYDYGPWYAGIDSWARRFELYPAIRRCNFELGAIDPYLDGTTRRKTAIALLYNRTASIWAQADNSCPMNASFTHWALAHAGYDADFVSEEQVVAGDLANDRVLYLDGPHLARTAALRIADWVRSGGVLFGSAGAATRDEFDQPMDVLETVFGAKSLGFAPRAPAGRPKYELRSLKPLAQLVPAAGARAPAVAAVAQLCLEEGLQPLPGAEPILTDGSGRVAGVLNRAGRGTAVRVAALPGVAYAHQASQPPYDPDSYLPKNFPADVRDFVAWPATLAGVAPVATTQSPIAEVVRYDGPGRAVVFLIDHRAEPDPHFRFELPDAGEFAQAFSASGRPVTLEKRPGARLRVTLPLETADAVVLRAARGP